MTHQQKVLDITTSGQGLYEFTSAVVDFVRSLWVECGLATLFVRHTSASIIIQENADHDVQLDMKEFFSRLVPEHMDWVRHTCEGPDDMPAHIKAALTARSVSIPIMDGHLVLGTWQGIYLFEHRDHAHQRQVVLHVSG